MTRENPDGGDVGAAENNEATTTEPRAEKSTHVDGLIPDDAALRAGSASDEGYAGAPSSGDSIDVSVDFTPDDSLDEPRGTDVGESAQTNDVVTSAADIDSVDEVLEMDELEVIEDIDVLELDAVQEEELQDEATQEVVPPARPPRRLPTQPPSFTPPAASGEATDKEGRPRLVNDTIPADLSATSESLEQNEAPAEAQLDANQGEAKPIQALETFADYARGRKAKPIDELAREIEEVLASTDDARMLAELAHALGIVHDRLSGDEARATKAFGRALQADPSLRCTMWAIRDIYYRRKLWPNLLELIDAEIETCDEKWQVADLLLEKGRIEELHGGDLHSARDSYLRALESEPRPVTGGVVNLCLERIGGKLSDQLLVQEARKRLSQLATKPAMQAVYQLELADYAYAGGALQEALSWLDQAGKASELREDTALRKMVWAIRDRDDESLLAAIGQHLSALLARREAAGLGVADTERANLDAEIVSGLRWQARVARRVDRDEEAWGFLQKAAGIAPPSPLLRNELLKLAQSLGKYEELAAFAESWQDEGGQSLSLSLARASALMRAGKTDAADDVLKALAAQHPTELAVLAAREPLLNDSQNYRGLAELHMSYAGLASEESPRDGFVHWVVAGMLCQHRVLDNETAERCYREAIALAPGSVEVVETLGALLVNGGRIEEAAHLLRAEIEHFDPKERKSKNEELYQLQLRAGDSAAALDSLRVGSAENPELLRAIVRHHCLDGAREPQIEALRKLAGLELDSGEKARALAELAILLEFLGRQDEAHRTWRELLSYWPHEAIVHKRLRFYSYQNEDWAGLVEIDEQIANDAIDSEEAQPALREQISVSMGPLRDAGRAKRALERILEHSPSDEAAMRSLAVVANWVGDRDALRKARCSLLENAHGEGDRRAAQILLEGDFPESLVERGINLSDPEHARASLSFLDRAKTPAERAPLWDQIAERVSSDGARAQVHSHAGWFWLAAGDTTRAENSFAQAAGEAASRLGFLFGAAAQSDAGRIQTALTELSKLATDDAVRNSLFVRAALFADANGDDANRGLVRRAAIDSGERSLRYAALESMSTPSPRGEEAVEELTENGQLIEHQIAAATGSDKLDWMLEYADTLERQGRLREASKIAMNVLHRDDRNLRALRSLYKIGHRAEHYELIAQAAAALADALSLVDARVKLYREAATIFDRRLGDIAKAVICYRRILELDPGAGESARLISIYEEHEDLTSLYRLLSQRYRYLEKNGETELAALALVKRAILRTRLEDSRGALRDAQKALDSLPDNLDALLIAAQESVRAGHSEGAVTYYRKYLVLETRPEEVATAELELARVLAENDNDLTGAVQGLRNAIEQRPGDVDARSRLVDCLVRMRKHAQALGELRALHELRMNDRERARDKLRMAELMRNLGDPQQCAVALNEARELDPLNLDVVRELVRNFGGVEEQRVAVLTNAKRDVRMAIVDSPGDVLLYERLATICDWHSDAKGLRWALMAAKSLGEIAEEHEEQLRIAEQIPDQVESGKAVSLESFAPAAFLTIAGKLWNEIAEIVVEHQHLDPSSLGFGRPSRMKERDLIASYPAVAHALTAVGDREGAFFVSSERLQVARATSGERRALLLGEDVAKADTKVARFRLARAVAKYATNSGALDDLGEKDVVALFSGLRSALQSETVSSDDLANEWKARFDRKLGRRGRKSLTGYLADWPTGEDIIAWYRSIAALAVRFAVFWAGDLPAALDALDVGRGGRSLGDDSAALSLVAWSCGEAHIRLREKHCEVDGD